MLTLTAVSLILWVLLRPLVKAVVTAEKPESEALTLWYVTILLVWIASFFGVLGGLVWAAVHYINT